MQSPTRIGPFRVIGPHPGGGYRAVDGNRRVRIELAEHVIDWRARAVQLVRAGSLVAKLQHPGIARIVDRGVVPDPVDPRPWVAYELADGVALSEILTRRTLSVDEVVELIRDLSSILLYVHERGLVHDALQPHAIVMRTGPREFPIQLGSWSELRADDGTGDIHALGVLAYRGLTGKFPGMNPPEVIAGVPAPVSSLVVRMLAVDPDARPDAEQVALEIAALAGDRSGPRFARPRWTPQPAELQAAVEVITLPVKRT